MKKNRNFVSHALQTVHYNSGQHKNKKRLDKLKGRHSKHKKDNKLLHDCYPLLLTFYNNNV